MREPGEWYSKARGLPPGRKALTKKRRGISLQSLLKISQLVLQEALGHREKTPTLRVMQKPMVAQERQSSRKAARE